MLKLACIKKCVTQETRTFWLIEYRDRGVG